jgi:parallel beta helix pectate lyase-like protein
LTSGPAAGRPFIVVAAGGRLDATDATFSDLGTLPNDPDNRTGVQFNPGSSGALVRTTMARNSMGLRLSGTQDVRLDGLTVQESAGDGLVLQGDRATTLRKVRAERNGGNGVLVKGASSSRPITDIATAGNGAYGLAVVGQTAPRITGVVTAGDAIGGLRINRSGQVRVTDFTATDQPIGIFTHVGSTGLELERVTISGGRRGIVVEKSTSALQLRETTIDGASVVGISVGGKEVQLDQTSISGARTAVRVERGAAHVTATTLRLAGGEDGIVANPGSVGVVVRDLVADGIGNDAVRTYAPDTQIIGARITGADTGIVAVASAAVADTAITQVNTGLRVRNAGGVVSAERIDVAAPTVGIDVAPGSPAQLRDSRVHALQALRGQVLLLGFNDLSLPPLNLLGAIGVPLILLAVVLELMHALRQRRYPRHRPRGLPPVAVPAGAR